jgi:hypothetical protein
MKTIAAFRDFSSRLSGGLGNLVTRGRAAVKKRFRRSWPGRVAWPWLRSPKYVTTVGGYHLYLHNTLLDPARQHWPCPVLLTSACETCHFLEYDRGGTPHCVAVLKLRTVLDGVDGGESLEEPAQR